jgi:hypothetical protein
MKRTISLMILVMAVPISFAHAQASAGTSSHLVFNGIPIDGPLSAFVLQMEKAGFSQIDSEDGYSLLRGDFGTYKNCDVAVETTKKDVVSKIAVIFPVCDTWSCLSSNYFSMKEKLTQEYGRPSDYVEKFKGGAPADDNSKMEAVKKNGSDYYTTYETPKGTIQLSIEHDSSLRCFVQLAYYDKINSEGM